MNRLTTAAVAIAAGLFVTAAPTLGQTTTVNDRVQVVADIGRDALGMNVLTTNVVLPKIVYIEVVYPELAEQLSIRGTTIVDVSLDDAGTVGTVAVEKSSGSHQLDQEAVWGVKGAKYEPETISGKRVAGKYSLRIDFGNQ